jgi:hypothetical protein
LCCCGGGGDEVNPLPENLEKPKTPHKQTEISNPKYDEMIDGCVFFSLEFPTSASVMGRRHNHASAAVRWKGPS